MRFLEEWGSRAVPWFRVPYRALRAPVPQEPSASTRTFHRAQARQPVKAPMRWWLSGHSGDHGSSGTQHYIIRSQDIQLICRESGLRAHRHAASRLLPVTAKVGAQAITRTRESSGGLQQPRVYFGKNRNRSDCQPHCLRRLETAKTITIVNDNRLC